MKRLRPLLLVLFSLAALAACHGQQKLSSFCVEQPQSCPPCASDQDCVIVSNPCHAFAQCAHRDAHLATTLEGCTNEYDVPPASRCRCVQSKCVSVE